MAMTNLQFLSSADGSAMEIDGETSISSTIEVNLENLKKKLANNSEKNLLQELFELEPSLFDQQILQPMVVIAKYRTDLNEIDRENIMKLKRESRVLQDLAHYVELDQTGIFGEEEKKLFNKLKVQLRLYFQALSKTFNIPVVKFAIILSHLDFTTTTVLPPTLLSSSMSAVSNRDWNKLLQARVETKKLPENLEHLIQDLLGISGVTSEAGKIKTAREKENEAFVEELLARGKITRAERDALFEDTLRRQLATATVQTFNFAELDQNCNHNSYSRGGDGIANIIGGTQRGRLRRESDLFHVNWESSSLIKAIAEQMLPLELYQEKSLRRFF